MTEQTCDRPEKGLQQIYKLRTGNSSDDLFPQFPPLVMLFFFGVLVFISFYKLAHVDNFVPKALYSTLFVVMGDLGKVNS